MTNGTDKLMHVTYDGTSAPAGIVMYEDGVAVAMTTTTDLLSASIDNAVAAVLGAQSDGTDGLNGTDGRGIQSMQCATGGWIITYTDGLNQADAGPCQGPQGVHGEQGAIGATGPQGTATPGVYACPDGEYMTGFSVAENGDVTLTCKTTFPPNP